MKIRNYTVKVFSRQGIENYSCEEHLDKSILISICDDINYPANVICNSDNNIQSIQLLEFFDIDEVRPDLKAMSMRDGEIIKKFIEDCQSKFEFDTILVNCEAGQSRSAGVAAAIMKYFNNDDTQIFDNPRYTPNMRCYRITLKSLY